MVTVLGGTLPVSSPLGAVAVPSFSIGKYETTWWDWKSVRTWATENGYDIGIVGAGIADTQPVQMVNWYDVLKWCNAKSEMEGLTPVYTTSGLIYRIGESVPDVNLGANGYRLPTEAEWEWAARGGILSRGYTYSGSNTVGDVAWYLSNSDGGPKAIGSKASNELGIYDMSGNLWEWCWDAFYGGLVRAVRGGAYDVQAPWCAVDFRSGNGAPGERLNIRTFRPVRSSGMVTVQGGTLPSSSELGAVSVSSFSIGKYETTWGEWKTVRTWSAANGYDIGNTGAGSADNHPVQQVSWYDVLKWCNSRSEKEGLTPVYTVGGVIYRTGEFGPDGSTAVSKNASANGYRLPTEAEWEWAARGGTLTHGYTNSGSNTIGDVAWYLDNSSGAAVDMYMGRGTWPVGQKAANELGLYDMNGNVWEWCWDVYSSQLSWRRVRGGAWDYSFDFCNVVFRNASFTADLRNYSFGFRLARSSGN
jgi:formylglycine-generating enzyme required for sulfatase activity